MELVLQLLAESGDVEREVAVGADRFTLGREEGNDLRLVDTKASRWHAAIEHGEDGWEIVDLGSANQTHLDGQPVAREPLADGQTLLLGKTSMRIVLRGTPAEPVATDAPLPVASAARRAGGQADEGHRRLRIFLLGTVLAFGFGVVTGRLTSPPSAPPAHDQVQPAPSPSGMAGRDRADLAERLLLQARTLRDAGQLGGAYAILRVLREGGVDETGDRLQATLDTLAAEILTAARRRSAAARAAGELELARRELVSAAGELAGTPLAVEARRDLAALDGLESLLAAEADGEPPAPTSPVVTGDAGASDAGADEAAGEMAAGRVPGAPVAGEGEGEAGARDTPAAVRVSRAEGELARTHLLSLLRRQRVDQAVEDAARVAGRLQEAAAPAPGPASAPRLEDWHEDLRWLVATMPWELRLRDALVAAANAREGEERLQLDLRGVEARVVGADAEGLTLALGEDGEGRQAWERVSAVHYVTLLAQLEPELGADIVQVAGAWARRGLPRAGLDLLADLHARGGEWAQGVEATLSAWQGFDGVPVGGYVSFRGDLVVATERDRILEEERAAEEAHRRELERLSATSPENLPRTLVDYARRLFADGSFERGHKVLRLIVDRFPEHEVTGEIRAQAEPNAILWSEVAHSWPRVVPGEDPPANRVDVLICGDGYLLSDHRQRSFSKAADRVIDGVLDHEPYLEYASYLVFRKVYGISEDKRVSTEYEKRSTLFEGFRPRMGGQVGINWGKTRGLLDASFPGAWDTALVMVRQGSLGKGVLFGDLCAFQEGAVQIAFHEMGHSFVDLLDEYSTDPYGGKPLRGPVPTGYNLVNSTDLQNCPWRHWIEAGEPGIGFHEGGAGRPKGVWHPSARGCVMNQGIDFCAVCREQAVLRIYEHVRPVERVDPPVDEILELDRPLGDPTDEESGVTLRVSLLKPATHALDVVWTIDGVRPARGRSIPYRDPRSGEWIVEARLPYAAFREGDTPNVVTATIHDPTPWVLADPRGLLTQEVSWQVVALPPEAVVTPESGGK